MATILERIIEAIDELAGNELWQCSTGVNRDETGRYLYDDAYVKWQAWQASQTFTEAKE